ncbi:choline/ethanolamine kinase family protein [Clostridium tetani]|uniref:choline/ethanolamine kinase family protein n=1 Tax=Clostridium tetani TaxID=1513 RepID=UPI00100C0304|nr:choline/ethanolamine kinase family protein [Clostridium tetani]RXM68285.1 choline kinase [Clostridium tetani]
MINNKGRMENSEIKNDIAACLNLNENKIHNISPIGGMTNKNYKFTLEDKEYVIRIPGTGTSHMINRLNEKINLNLVDNLGIDAKLIYFDIEKGIKISELIKETEPLNKITIKKQCNMVLISDLLKKLHNSSIVFNCDFDVFEKIELYENILKEMKGEFFPDYDKVKGKIFKLKDILHGMNIKKYPCHNDTVSENFIKSGGNKINLIDWEYSGMNDFVWDISAYFLESEFNKEEEEMFLYIYFNENVNKSIRARIFIYKILQDLLWSVWTNIKECEGDDFGSYGIDRYNRAKCNLELLEKQYKLF